MIDDDVILGEDVRIFDPSTVNLFGCTLGPGTFVGPFVEITRNVKTGRNCAVQSHAFLCDSVELEDDVFVSHGAMFTNDLYPNVGVRVRYLPTLVKRGASIGTNATIVAGVTIGRYAVVGAGSVVTKDVPDYTIVAGNPARALRSFESRDDLLQYMRSRQPVKSAEKS
jgi:UDP-2-acetamido-3-amino-2,3-dideoxy-glucuronate N-acetyltransferase